MCTAPVDFARLAGRSTRGTAPGMGGDLQEQWGVRGDPPQAGHGGGGGLGKETAGEDLGMWF
jgi:hypothetical protein